MTDEELRSIEREIEREGERLNALLRSVGASLPSLLSRLESLQHDLGKVEKDLLGYRQSHLALIEENPDHFSVGAYRAFVQANFAVRVAYDALLGPERAMRTFSATAAPPAKRS